MSFDRLRVGNFNLLNLALPNQAYYPKQSYTPQVYQQKISWIAEQLRRMQADIVGFQEVFQPAALRAALDASGLYPQQKATLVCAERSGSPTELAPIVALVSTVPVLGHTVIEQFPAATKLELDGVKLPVEKFSRPVLAVRVQLNPGAEKPIEAMIFVVHLKSKRPMLSEGADPEDPIERAQGQARSLIRRAAEAAALRVLIMEYLRDQPYPVIVMGDFNDTGHAVTTQIIAGEPPPPHWELADKLRVWDVVLYPVRHLMPRNQDFYYTHIHNGHHEDLDHILVSQEFTAQNPKNIGKISYVSVLNDHLIDETLARDRIPAWQSDHAQVIATIALKG